MKNRRIAAATSLLVCAVVGIAMVGTGTSNAITPTAVSTPGAPGGWANGGGSETSPTYVAGPTGGDGDGALLFATPTAAAHVDYYQPVNVPLAGVSGLSYAMNSTGGPQASYQLQICSGGISAGPTCNGYTTLVYEPYQNGGTLIGDGGWHTFGNLEHATFWSTHSIPGDVGSSPTNQLQVSLSAVEAANPNAVVIFYGISQGSNNPGSASYVDDISFKGATTDFATALSPTITTHPNVTVYQTTPAGTPATYVNPTATDPNTGHAAPVACTPASGSVFPVGTTTVTCTATEPEGFTASSTFTLTVQPVTTSCEGLPYTDRGYLTAHPNYGANTQITPCVTSSYSQIGGTAITLLPAVPLLHIPATGLNLSVLHGVSSVAVSPSIVSAAGNSTIAAVSVSVVGLTLSAHALYSQATALMSGGLCTDEVTSGLSDIANLTINGKAIVVGTGPISIKLGLINVYVNQTVKVGNTVTQRALVINLGGDPANDIVIGQAVAGVACS